MADKPTVWIVSQYEPAPGETHRPLRAQHLARALIARGYAVVQWSACFSHRARATVAAPWDERQIAPDWLVRFVPNPAYSGNVGAKRLASESHFARNFRKRARSEPPPVCIVAAASPVVVGSMAVEVGREFGVPVVSDVLDLWPEFFHRVLPRRVRGAGRVVFAPLYARRRRMWSSVDGIAALSKSYLQHAIDAAPALARVPQAAVYSSVDVDAVQRLVSAPSEAIDKALGTKPAGEVWIGYAGALGESYEIPVFLRAAATLKARGAAVRFVVAGFGPYTEAVREAAEREGSNVTFLGALPPNDLYPMLGRCDLGLLSYAPDSNVAMPDKFYDYAAVGLPIVNSLQGEVKTIIEARELGVSYTPGDADSMAGAIESLAADPGRRAAMRERAVEAARSWDAPAHFELFADLVEATIRAKG